MTIKRDIDIDLAGSPARITASKLRGILHKLHRASPVLSVLDVSPDGTDLTGALNAAVEHIASLDGTASTLWVPRGDWTVSEQVLFNLSNFTLLLDGNISLTGTDRQKTLLFAYDTNQQPTRALSNVRVVGNGSVIDGNGAAMSFSYAHGDGSDNDSAIRFNRIDGLHVEGLHATNGPIDSMSVRQCRNFRVRGCEFSDSREDNGFSATTDWGTWASGDISTWGHGTVEDCVAHGNKDFGMTAYNASGVWFKNCRSYGNDQGFSYEDNAAARNAKDYRGGFQGCIANNNASRGFYIDADDVTIDDQCHSWNNRGTPHDNTNSLYEHGVVVSNVNRAYVGGTHRNNGKAGVALFNGMGQAMRVTVGGRIEGNDWHGIYGRGVGSLVVKPGTEIRDNAAYGVSVSNSGGEDYLQDAGSVYVAGSVMIGNASGGASVTNATLRDSQASGA